MNQRATLSYLCKSATGQSREFTSGGGGYRSFLCWTWLLAGLLFVWTPNSLGGKTVSGSILFSSTPAYGEELIVVCPSGDDPGNDNAPGEFLFSTGPFNCTAIVNPPPPEIRGGCAPYTWSFELWGMVSDPVTGVSEYALVGRSTGQVLTGVVPGLYDLRYLVQDNCGQQGLVMCSARVADAIDPIALCRQDLVLAADDLNTDSRGITAMEAGQLDNGSRDNCAVARLLARRQIDLSCLESFARIAWDKKWPEDFTERADDAGQDLSYFLLGSDTLLVRRQSVFYSWWSDELWFTCCDGGDSGEGRIGVELKVVDDAGNSAICSSVVTFLGGGASPAFSCIQGVVLPLAGIDADGDGQWEDARLMVQATDLLSTPALACEGEVIYAVNRTGENPDPQQKALEFTCADPRLTPINVEVHAWDQAGNHSVCETFVILEDSDDLCRAVGKNGSIAGVISTEKGLVVPEIKVTLTGGGAGVASTDGDGSFEFAGLDEGRFYEVRPSKEDDYLNGVTTYDLVLISKHIQGLLPLESPYLLIAADLNNSGTITTLDMIQLRQMVLSVDTEFRNNASWRFIDAAYRFPNPVNPWKEPFPESITFDALNGRQEGRNFIAVKIGDVNGNVVPRSAQELEDRSDAGLVFAVDDQGFEAGDEVQVKLASPRLSALEGLQFTLDYAPAGLELVEVAPGLAGREDLGLFPDRGLITASWSPYFQPPRPSADPATFMTLVFRSRSAGRLSEMLRITSLPTRAEAYEEGGEAVPVMLNYAGLEASGRQAILYQNRPNPFGDHTVVPFWVPEDAAVAFRITDARGQTVRQFRQMAIKGANELIISSMEFNEAGVWFLTMETSDSFQTIRLVVLE